MREAEKIYNKRETPEEREERLRKLQEEREVGRQQATESRLRPMRLLERKGPLGKRLPKEASRPAEDQH